MKTDLYFIRFLMLKPKQYQENKVEVKVCVNHLLRIKNVHNLDNLKEDMNLEDNLIIEQLHVLEIDLILKKTTTDHK